MIKKLVSFALHQPFFLLLITAIFIAAGVFAFKALPIEAFPDVTDVQVTVISLFPGHAPEEVEKQVTMPVELALSGLPHCARMFSHSQFGLSYVILTFDDKANDYFARQQVLERLSGIDLPPNVQPQLAPLSTAIGEIYRYRIKGNGLSPTDARTIQDWTISRYLKMIPGVADVTSFGGMIKQYQVSLDLAKMKSYKVTLQQIMTALGRGNSNSGGGYIEQGEQQYIIRGIGLLRSAEDIGNIVLTERGGTPLLIKDIAETTTDSVPRQDIVGQDNEDDVATGIVLMRKGENPSEVLQQVHERVETLNNSMLPKGVRIEPFYDRTALIHATLKTVFKNLIEGALLVALVLYLFLGHFKSAAIVAAIIPLSLLATFLGLELRGIPANLLSLGAIDFGIIVDGAVIIVENVFRKLSTHRDKNLESMKGAIKEAVIQVGRPTLFSMLIIIIAHIPILALQRQEGRIFAPMAYTIISALIGSLFFSMTLVPLFCFYFLRGDLPEHDNKLVSLCKRIYSHLLFKTLKRPKTVLICAISLVAASLFIVPKLGTEFLPELNEGTLWINITLPAGVSLSETSRICRFIRTTLMKFPEVNTVISKAGRPEDGTDPKTLNMTETYVDLKPEGEWKRKITRGQLLHEMDEQLSVLPGADVSFSQPIRDNVLESISQVDGQVIIKLFSSDPLTIYDTARNVLGAISKVRGVAKAFIDRAGEIPQLQITIDRQRASRYGLNVADVQDVIETALGGKEATEIWEGEQKFGVMVRLPDKARENIGSIRNLLIDTPSGMRIPLEEIAAVSIKNGRMNISRENAMRVAAISIFIGDRDMGSTVKEMQEVVKRSVSLPKGNFIVWQGEFENQQRAMKRLAVIVPIIVFLIFVLLFDAFSSAKNAFLILFTIPFAIVGGILILYVTKMPLSVSAVIGFIALSGQAVLNGVVMLTYFNDLRKTGMKQFEAVYNGAIVRLRPVLMTTLLAMFGFLPMALSKGIGSEVQKPLATVIIGGLISATVMTLFVLPVLYLFFEKPDDPA